jgi:hypothetical protein
MMSNEINEETALLSSPAKNSRTPLPKLQLSVIMLIQICEPIASQSIYPYINQVSFLWMARMVFNYPNRVDSWLVNWTSRAAMKRKSDIMREYTR